MRCEPALPVGQQPLALGGYDAMIEISAAPHRNTAKPAEEMNNFGIIRDAQHRHILRSRIDEAMKPHPDQQFTSAHFLQHLQRSLALGRDADFAAMIPGMT